MTIHLTWWWLWVPLIIVYAFGVLVGMWMTLLADDVPWWLRPGVLIWPVAVVITVVHRMARFMIGRE